MMNFFLCVLVLSLLPASSLSLSSAPRPPTSSGFSLKGYSKAVLPLITSSLEESLKHQTIPQTKTISSAMSYSLLAGGKRVRPLAVLMGYDYVLKSGPSITPDDKKWSDSSVLKSHYEKVMPIAVGVEMIHTMSLIHDDLPCMDDDSLRRGVPTCHVVYGEDVAVLAGDSLLSSAFEWVARECKGKVDSGRVLDVIERFGKAVGNIGLAGGQVKDLEMEGE